MRTHHRDPENPYPMKGSHEPEADASRPDHADAPRRPDLAFLPESASDVFDALEDMSRRIDDLARELNCLGFFDDDDGPRAA